MPKGFDDEPTPADVMTDRFRWRARLKRLRTKMREASRKREVAEEEYEDVLREYHTLLMNEPGGDE